MVTATNLLAQTVGVVCTAYAVSKIVKSCNAARGREQSQKHLCSERLDPKQGPHAHVLGERYVKNSRGFYVLRRHWKAEKPNGHAVVLVHGFSEHIGRYEHMAAAITAAGFEVYGMDHQGHGGSEGDRVFMTSVWDHVEDVLQLVRDAAGPSGRKVLAVGHSMGGMFLALCALKAPELFKAIVLSAPGLWSDPKTPQGLLNIIKAMGTHLPRLEFPGVDAQKICRTEAVVRSFQLDPLVHHGGMPMATVKQILEGMEFISKHASSFSLPLLLQHGSLDTLVPVDATEWFHSAVGSSNKSKLIYEGCFHEVYNECEEDCGVERNPTTGVTTNRAMRDAVEWLSARASED